jgi:Ran-binding protein 9/10
VPRRLSYASVASGASHNIHHPTRSGAFSHLATAVPGGTHSPQTQSEPHFQRRYSEHDQDALGASHWRKPTPLPAYSRKFADIQPQGTGVMATNPFFIPSYLRSSRYMARLEAAHKAKMKREREQPGGLSALSAFSSSPGNARLAPSHRGMTYDIIESNPPREEEPLPQLPSRWSEQDRHPGLDIMSDGQDLRYSGSASKAETEAASVRTDRPMPIGCGIYYFEVEIKQKSKDTAIALGFSTSDASLERLPGWETHSWGYHGDDGKMFFGEHSGRSYGPTFGAGDVIGCGVNFNTCQSFFTKNGRDLGICFRELKKDLQLYPMIGMKKHSGALVTTNFGQSPFVFDIDDKVFVENANVSRDIAKARTTSLRPPKDESGLIQELVAHFLAHDGYVETAKAFAEEMRREKQSLNNALPSTNPLLPERDDADAVHRQSKFCLPS